ncbi:uncharacterized protein KY384_008371 [Bacidia gigantensis]|uniref:uncharacterized protein n=1 Tax=Bacidia gigantensis TaxID=2732470 RepID=UPI001D057100|nr:uncharacterized protein KY384_008371 [Bacidia gigantensis]KAG8526942.1 hypothetical protein KY384_008371 [Bacidia gigantensis]
MVNSRKRATSTRPTTPSAEQFHPESLLWAYRLQKGHRQTNQRLDECRFNLQTSISNTDTGVTGLQGDVKVLSANLKILSSQQEALQRQLAGLERQVKKTNPNGQLSTNIETLAQDQADGLATLGQHFIFLRSETQSGLATLRADVSTLQGVGRDRPPLARHGSPHNSEATTMGTDYANHETTSKAESEFDALPLQGHEHLETHLELGGTIISNRLRKHEEDLCKSFIAGLTEQGYQAVLRSRLRQVGWTWGNVNREIGPMLRKGDRRLRGGKVRKVP